MKRAGPLRWRGAGACLHRQYVPVQCIRPMCADAFVQQGALPVSCVPAWRGQRDHQSYDDYKREFSMQAVGRKKRADWIVQPSSYSLVYFSPGLGPVPRRLTALFSISNQNGAPCMAANAVIKMPPSFASKLLCSVACGVVRHRPEDQGIPKD